MLLSLSPHEERVGREPERGALRRTELLLSPTLSSLLRREERENGTRAWALFADMVAESAQNLKSNARLTAWVSVLPNFMRPEIFSASQDGSVVPK